LARVLSIVPYQELAFAKQPLSLVMERLVGEGAPEMLSVIALFATANTVLITLIVSARMLYGMANNRSLPDVLARVHKKRRTPWIAVWVVAAFFSVWNNSRSMSGYDSRFRELSHSCSTAFCSSNFAMQNL
jgi:APA family basic amino acid/polyamine antiporter